MEMEIDLNETQSEESAAGNTAKLAAPRSSVGRSVVAGMAGGAVATLAMSALMVGAQKLGLLGEMPPKKIARRAARFAGLWGRSRRAENAAAAAAHWGFGMGTGGIYGLMHRGRWGMGRSALLGVGFGSAVWAVSYAGWVPAMGIMSLPHRDRPFRPATMFAAHLLFGSVLGAFVEHFTTRGASGARSS